MIMMTESMFFDDLHFYLSLVEQVEYEDNCPLGSEGVVYHLGQSKIQP